MKANRTLRPLLSVSALVMVLILVVSLVGCDGGSGGSGGSGTTEQRVTLKVTVDDVYFLEKKEGVYGELFPGRDMTILMVEVTVECTGDRTSFSSVSIEDTTGKVWTSGHCFVWDDEGYRMKGEETSLRSGETRTGYMSYKFSDGADMVDPIPIDGRGLKLVVEYADFYHGGRGDPITISLGNTDSIPVVKQQVG